MSATAQLLRVVTDEEQDFEWYPTTDEIINCIKNDLYELGDYRHQAPSVLDCGAGDGRVLKALTTGDKYAIEKSRPLINALSRDIFVVGTEFQSQTLIDKQVDVVFSNPPYSQFEEWAAKIIREANCTYIYLVIPTRWQSNKLIAEAIEVREAKWKCLASFDFLNAERAARAKVDVIRFETGYRGRRGQSKVDPFAVWFDEYFKIDASESELAKYRAEEEAQEELARSVSHELAIGGDIVSTLERFYQRDMDNLMNTYRALGNVDGNILRELDVNANGVRKALKQKIAGLKNLYWKELFDNLSRVTDRLTASSRKMMLAKLWQYAHVDFSASNAHAVLIWVIKNANTYFDDQLIELVERMTEKASVVSYKSNQRTFGAEEWRYARAPEGLSHYGLDYRIVLERCGGISTSSWGGSVRGLSERAADLLNDIRAVASNLGFDIKSHYGPRDVDWEAGKPHTFYYTNIYTGGKHMLFEARAFKNGNLHIKLNQELICRLNVEFGRLKGWIKSPKEAADELGVAQKDADQWFGANLQLDATKVLTLGFDSK